MNHFSPNRLEVWNLNWNWKRKRKTIELNIEGQSSSFDLKKMSPSPSPASPSPSNGKAVTIDDTTLSVNTEVANLTAADPGGSGRSGSIGSGSTVACYATYNSPRDPLHMELEVWYATDTLSTGEVIRSVPVRTHSIDIKRGLLVGDVGHRDGTGKNGCVVPIGRSRKIPKKRQPVANYIEQHSWVEVWTMLPGGNELSNSQGRKHLGMHAWYLAEVSVITYLDDIEVNNDAFKTFAVSLTSSLP